MNNKPIKHFSNEELEKLELQLWRQKHAYTASLEQITNDLSIITSELASREKSDDSTDGQAAAS